MNYEKSVKLCEETHTRLKIFAAKHKYKTFDDAINKLLSVYPGGNC
jgi:hypothetical protein